MKIGIPKEVLAGETRVALTPEIVKRLTDKDLRVVVERGAGSAAAFSDEAYQQAGADLAEGPQAVLGESDLVVKVRAPAIGGDGLPDEVGAMKQGAALIALLDPLGSKRLLERLAGHGLTAMALELIPRISRAQNMDVLSSMATVAGYKAVLLAANEFQRFFPMFMTAAGTIPPAHALILGAGVAGLQAIATAKRLGAAVQASDIRPEVKEQVESLGARFVGIDISAEEASGSGGYAKALSADRSQQLLDAIAGRLPRTDIVITTAQIPGRPAPVLLTAAMLKKLKPGSVIVDLAVESGGNCELTELDRTIVHEGVTIIGTANLPALMPVHASQMFARNVGNLLNHLLDGDGLNLDMADPITSGVVVTRDGKIVHPALQGS